MRPAPTIMAAVVALTAVAATTLPARPASEASALRQLSSPVAGDATLTTFIGKWTGDGTIRRSSAAAEEPVQCRLTNNWTAESKLMKMQLSCRGLDYQFAATGYVGRSGSIYRGSMTSTVSGEANVAGKRSGNGLNFTMVSNNQKGVSQSNLSIKIAGSSVINTVRRTDPETGRNYTALNVTMRQ